MQQGGGDTGGCTPPDCGYDPVTLAPRPIVSCYQSTCPLKPDDGVVIDVQFPPDIVWREDTYAGHYQVGGVYVAGEMYQSIHTKLVNLDGSLREEYDDWSIMGYTDGVSFPIFSSVAKLYTFGAGWSGHSQATVFEGLQGGVGTFLGYSGQVTISGNQAMLGVETAIAGQGIGGKAWGVNFSLVPTNVRLVTTPEYVRAAGGVDALVERYAPNRGQVVKDLTVIRDFGQRDFFGNPQSGYRNAFLWANATAMYADVVPIP